MTRVVVSDTSPIRALAHLGQLGWLHAMFGQVFVPPAVAHELEFPPNPLHAVVPLQISFVVVTAPSDTARVAILRQSLDAGEAEALALAEELDADVILIDESVGRQAAADAGFHVLGTLGVLLHAKSKGWCPSIESLLIRLEKELRFFIAPALREAVLVRAGEKP